VNPPLYTVSAYFLQRMKTKWGSCNRKRGNVRLNTELVKKPKDLVEYVIVHELIHLLEPTHNDRFIEWSLSTILLGRKRGLNWMSCPYLLKNGKS